MSAISKFLKNKANDVSFIELKKKLGKEADNLNIPGGLPVPILTDELVKDIIEERAQEQISFNSLIKGMLYIIGADPMFVYVDKYKNILLQIEDQVEKYVLWLINDLENKNIVEEAIVFSHAYAILFSDKRAAHLNYALCLEHMAQNHMNKKDINKANIFLKAADEELNILLDIDETYAPALYKLGYHAKYNKSFIRAKVFWDKFLTYNLDEELDIEIKAELLKINKSVNYEEGCQLVLRGKAEEGLEKLLPLFEENKSWWNLSFMMGIAYRQLEEYSKAIDSFENALKYESKNAMILNELAISKASLGFNEEAYELFEKAIQIDSTDSGLFSNRAMLNMNLKKYEAARNDLEEALKLNPSDEIALLIKKQIGNIN